MIWAASGARRGQVHGSHPASVAPLPPPGEDGGTRGVQKVITESSRS